MKKSAKNTNHVTVETEETIQVTTLLHAHLPKGDYTPVFLFFLEESTIGYFTQLYPLTVHLLPKTEAP